MGKTTGIEWTDSTWNPIRGCSRVSEGCRNCYAEGVAARFSGKGQAYEGLATFKLIGEKTPEEHLEPRWTGEVRLIEEHVSDPLHWKAPRKIFVNSMSDLFHPGVSDSWLDQIFDVMSRAPQHTYQILTKRPERMKEYLDSLNATIPPHIWCGVSIEDQETANHRLPILAEMRCTVRFVSYEPAIGPVNFEESMGGLMNVASFDWIIVGGESGPRARPMHPDWARSIRDLCQDHGIAFFFKQWGEWAPSFYGQTPFPDGMAESDSFYFPEPHEPCKVWKFGKHRSGANLDGVEWREFPNVNDVAVS